MWATLIIVAPGVTRPETRTSRAASFSDLFPTLNERCGLPRPAQLEGTSLVPLLKNPNQTWERPALVTYLKGNHAVCSERWRYIRYADGGRSWAPVEMAMHYTGPLILNAGIVRAELEGRKRFLLPAHRNTLQKDPFGSRHHFILSSTSLLEWKLEAFIPQPKTGKVFLHEGNIAPGDEPGELKIVMRTAQYEEDSLTTDPPRAYSSVTRDGGRTRSPAVPEPELHNAKSKGFFGRASDGTHIYVHNDGPAQRDIAPGFPPWRPDVAAL